MVQNMDNIYNDFSTSTEVISIHRTDNFSVDVGDFLFSQLSPHEFLLLLVHLIWVIQVMARK